MREGHLKRFAAIFALLVFLSGNDARVYFNGNNDYHSDESLFDIDKDLYRDLAELPSKGLTTYVAPNEKRFVGVALLAIAAISAGFDIYKQERGCADAEPDLARYVSEANALTETAKRRRNEINLAWSPIYDVESYFSRLGGEINIMRQHIAKLDSLKSDIVQLLDQKFFTRMDLVKRQIENDIVNLNDTRYGDPNVYLAKFYDQTIYAIILTAKLLPVGLYLGAKFLGPYITKAVAKFVNRQFASGSPNLIARGIRQAQTRGPMFPKTRAAFNKFITSPIKARFNALNPKVQSGLSKTGTVIKNFGKGAIVGVFLAYEIYNGWKFFTDCTRKKNEAKANVAMIKESLRNMTKVENDMNAYKNELIGYYGLLFGNISSDNALEFVEETYNLTVNSQYQNATIEQNARDIKDFHDNIRSKKTGPLAYNYAEIERLMKKLNSAYLKTSFKLECYRRKMVVLASVIRDCAKGIGNGDSLWATAETLHGSVLKECVEKDRYLTKAGVLASVAGVMTSEQKSPICLRNNPQTQGTVCTKWQTYLSDADIQKGTPLTLADVAYFVSKCTPADVTATIESGICRMKSEKKTLAQIRSTYSRHNSGQVGTAYSDKCLLTDTQKNVICNDKKSHLRESVVAPKFPGYKGFAAAYAACPPDSASICRIYGFFIMLGMPPPTADSPAYKNDTIIYGKPAIQSVIDTVCAAAGDAPQPEENAFDMLAESIETSSNDEDQHGGDIKKFLNVQVCHHIMVSESYAEIVDGLTDADVEGLKGDCAALLAEANRNFTP